MSPGIARTAEHVGRGHPDKFCDQLADAILDESLRLCGTQTAHRDFIRTAIECLVKDNSVLVSGETRWPSEIQAAMMCGGKGSDGYPLHDIQALARNVWNEVGYGDREHLAVTNNVRSQSIDIAEGGGTGVDAGGAGDQGIMVGYATDESPEMMPREWLLARNICMTMEDLWKNGTLPWLRSDCKSQVTLDSAGRITNVIIAAQHADVDLDEVRNGLFMNVLKPTLDEQVADGELTWVREEGKPIRFRYGRVEGAINGTGKFVTGGSIGDAGVVGRKIVVDAYGPRVPVGGGAYSGKDPSKVDRSAAYMARCIAKAAVTARVRDAHECTVALAYGIGQVQPEMIAATTDTGADISEWVKEKFKDLSPNYIIDYLSLRKPTGWCYRETAAYGHYGRAIFPWEQVAANV